MRPEDYIGKTVMHVQSRAQGKVVRIVDDRIYVNFHGNVSSFLFPAAFAGTLVLKDDDLRASATEESRGAAFESFKLLYTNAVNNEIKYLKTTGGSKYRIIDGERLPSGGDSYVYLFETDSEFHFPDRTPITLWFPENIVRAYILSCEEFTITFQTADYLGEKIETVEFTAEQWHLLEALNERIAELDAYRSPIAYSVAHDGMSRIDRKGSICTGQDNARRKAGMEQVIFIWGPPGTGKTTTLSAISADYIVQGKRVLMLSYSNVSVDGALLKVAKRCEDRPGKILRYGYPRSEELQSRRDLTSYGLALSMYPEIDFEIKELQKEATKVGRRSPRYRQIHRQIAGLRSKITDAEKALIQKASFVATTVSKAAVDSSIYGQRFDLVLFDEASMAYVPQVVFAASLAKTAFCCLGDFRQLPAIVADATNDVLKKDIFEYTGIVTAVEHNYGHDWLVMLTQQYRMHPIIADFASRYMYGGMLSSENTIFARKQTIADFAPFAGSSIGMIDLSGSYSVCIKTKDGSRINLMSAMLSLRVAEQFAGQYEVGIITPYSAQSRLLLSMLRDLRERNKVFNDVASATVHQFQGSEKSIIIYDAVDCFRMPYPGTLLTRMQDNEANRLFNVAITRAEGKFILIANKNYLEMKNLSEKLLFSQCIDYISRSDMRMCGEEIIDALGSVDGENNAVYFGHRDEEDSWNKYLKDLLDAKKVIAIDAPGKIDDDYDALADLAAVLQEKKENGISITVRAEEITELPASLSPYRKNYPYVTTPITIIDRRIVWFGEPLCAAQFVSSGKSIKTEYPLCLRFEGIHMARQLKSIFDISYPGENI